MPERLWGLLDCLVTLFNCGYGSFKTSTCISHPFFLWDGKRKKAYIRESNRGCGISNRRKMTVLYETQSRLFLTDKTTRWNHRAVSWCQLIKLSCGNDNTLVSSTIIITTDIPEIKHSSASDHRQPGVGVRAHRNRAITSPPSSSWERDAGHLRELDWRQRQHTANGVAISRRPATFVNVSCLLEYLNIYCW